jgi:hypothetical protein
VGSAFKKGIRFGTRELRGYSSEPTLNKVIVTGYSGFIEMRGKTEDLLLSEKLMMGLPEAVEVVTCVGIEFYQEAGGKMNFLQSKSCMKIAEVF